MNNEPAHNLEQPAIAERRTWTAPEVHRMNASDAENAASGAFDNKAGLS